MSEIPDFTPITVPDDGDELALPDFVESREALLARLTPRERFALHAAEMRRVTRVQEPTSAAVDVQVVSGPPAAPVAAVESVESLEDRIARLAEQD